MFVDGRDSGGLAFVLLRVDTTIGDGFGMFKTFSQFQASGMSRELQQYF